MGVPIFWLTFDSDNTKFSFDSLSFAIPFFYFNSRSYRLS